MSEITKLTQPVRKELAIALKEAGYNENVFSYYDLGAPDKLFKIPSGGTNQEMHFTMQFAAPTIAEAVDWLCKKSIKFNPPIQLGGKWEVFDYKDWFDKKSRPKYDTLGEAYHAEILRVCHLIIKQKEGK